MSTNFPTSLDSYTTKVDGTDYPQASHINNPQDAIMALEAKVGVNSSAVTTSHDYKLSRFTFNGANVGIGVSSGVNTSLIVGGSSEGVIQLARTSAAADSGRWRTMVDSANGYTIGTINDAYSTGQDAYVINRTGTTTVDYHRWFTSNTEKMRLANNGNLSLVANLTVGDTSQNSEIWTYGTGSGTGGGSAVGTVSGANWVIAMGNKSKMTAGTYSNEPWINANGNLVIASIGTELARFSTTGFGIGVTPSVKLHVKSAGELTRWETTTSRGNGNNYLAFFDPTGRKGYMGYGGGGGDDAFYINNEMTTGMSIRTNGVAALNISSAGVITDQYGVEVGWKIVPRTTGGVANGQCYAASAGFTLNTGFAAGTCFSIYNDSASAITITQGGGLTLRLAGTTTTGNRTLAARGMATVWCNSTTEYIMTGAGVT